MIKDSDSTGSEIRFSGFCMFSISFKPPSNELISSESDRSQFRCYTSLSSEIFPSVVLRLVNDSRPIYQYTLLHNLGSLPNASFFILNMCLSCFFIFILLLPCKQFILLNTYHTTYLCILKIKIKNVFS